MQRLDLQHFCSIEICRFAALRFAAFAAFRFAQLQHLYLQHLQHLDLQHLDLSPGLNTSCVEAVSRAVEALLPLSRPVEACRVSRLDASTHRTHGLSIFGVEGCRGAVEFCVELLSSFSVEVSRPGLRLVVCGLSFVHCTL